MKRFFLLILIVVWSSVTIFAKSAKENSEDNISKTNSIFFNDIVSQDTFIIQTSDCVGTGAVCIDVPMMNVGNYTFSDNGMMYSGGFQNCLEVISTVYDYSQLFGQGGLGPHMLDDWNIDGVSYSGVFNTITDLVDSMNLWNPEGNWVLDGVNQTITGGESGSIYSIIDVTITSINAPSTIPFTSNSTFDGVTMNLTVGTHLVQVLENGGGMCLDSFFVNVVCVQPNIENLTLEEDSVHVFCFDNSEFLGQPTTLEILCPDNPGTPVDFSLTTGNSCVEITTLNLGQDTACYVICDNFGICDTTNIYVDVVPPVFNGTVSWITDTIYANSTQQICIDTSEMAGLVVGISNGCPGQSGEFVVFNIDANSYCVDYSGIEIGQDTACIEVIDNYGNVDTTYIVARVLNPAIDTMFQSIDLSSTGNFCIDTVELGGTVSSINDICNEVGGVASFTLDSVSLCYEALPNEVGQDTACIVVCDDFGTCDTTILIVEVTEVNTATNLVAMDDAASIMLGEQLDLNICDNDTIPNGFLTNYYILPISFGGLGPTNGLVSFDSECNINYLPTAQNCGVQDTFNYVICNTEGCDTAMVIVDIICEPTVNNAPLEFANGFSPNGDEVNQYFTIKGVESLPTSSLTIYNRWGNQVYKTDNYQNDWDGTFNGTTLQNGTYFYLFQDGVGNTYSGYVYLQR